MQKITVMAGVAALGLATAVASPSHAWVHHQHTHHTARQSHESAPAERQETAELNRQQLAQAQSRSSGGGMATNVSTTNTGTATRQNGLATEPANYQRTRPSSAGISGNAAGSPSIGSEPGTESGIQQIPNSAAPPGAVRESNPSGTTTPPPPASPPGGSQ